MENIKTEPQHVYLIIAEDDEGHASLIIKNLKRAGFNNDILHLKDGQKVLDFLFMRGEGPHRILGNAYRLLLGIRMPKVDGVEVLRTIKEDPELSKMPVIMVTTTDDPREVNQCHKLGCSNYVTKPVEYEQFVDAARKLGLFLSIIQVPTINGVV